MDWGHPEFYDNSFLHTFASARLLFLPPLKVIIVSLKHCIKILKTLSSVCLNDEITNYCYHDLKLYIFVYPLLGTCLLTTYTHKCMHLLTTVYGIDIFQAFWVELNHQHKIPTYTLC